MAFETKIGESAATTSAHHLPARKGARVLAHGLPLPKPETVILANQNNFSIFHGISPSDLSGPLTAFALHEQSEPMSAGERESASVVAAAAMLSRVFELD